MAREAGIFVDGRPIGEVDIDILDGEYLEPPSSSWDQTPFNGQLLDLKPFGDEGHAAAPTFRGHGTFGAAAGALSGLAHGAIGPGARARAAQHRPPTFRGPGLAGKHKHIQPTYTKPDVKHGPTFRPGLTPRGAAPAAKPEKITLEQIQRRVGKDRVVEQPVKTAPKPETITLDQIKTRVGTTPEKPHEISQRADHEQAGSLHDADRDRRLEAGHAGAEPTLDTLRPDTTARAPGAHLPDASFGGPPAEGAGVTPTQRPPLEAPRETHESGVGTAAETRRRAEAGHAAEEPPPSKLEKPIDPTSRGPGAPAHDAAFGGPPPTVADRPRMPPSQTGVTRLGAAPPERPEFTHPDYGGLPGEPDKYAGVGGYNFMGSARAREMGMGDVTAGSAAAQQHFATGIPQGSGPTSIVANKYAGPHMAGFLKDLHEAGAPLGDFSGVYNYREKRGGGGFSQHAYGNAMDIETGFGSGPNNSARLYAWTQTHPQEFADIQARHHMRNLDTSSGAGMHDWGHFEWTPTGFSKDQAVASAQPSAQPSVAQPRHQQVEATTSAERFGVEARDVHWASRTMPEQLYAIRREQFRDELGNNAVRQKLMASTLAEVGGQGQRAEQAYMESVMNRAAARGETLNATLSNTAYYPTRTQRLLTSPVIARDQMRLMGSLGEVMLGSNISRMATGNASGNVGFGTGGVHTAGGNLGFGDQ